MIKDVKLVTVENLDPALIQHYGRFQKMGIQNAMVGTARGKWRIVPDDETSRGSYETQVMTPRPNALGTADLKGLAPSPKNLKKKIIAWVQDQSRTGGAELTNAETVRIGRDCGFGISILTPHNSDAEMRKTLSEADLIVINNLWEFFPLSMHSIQEAISSARVPYVKFEHDHRELGRPDFSRRLFRNSALNVFLSPIHLENHQKALGCDGIALPLAIDPRPFVAVKNDKRQPGTALICNVRHFKTWTNLTTYAETHRDLRFTVYAERAVLNGPNIETLPMVPHERMPEIYGRFEYLVHLLDGWGAGERVIFEAALSGCKVVSSERAGHMSWGRDLGDKEGLAEWLTDAPYQFWREIDKL